METLIHKADGRLISAQEEGPYRAGRRIRLFGGPRVGTILPSEGRGKIASYQKWVLFDDIDEIVVHHDNMTFIDEEEF